MSIDAKRLQTRLGVADDGIIGRNTLFSLFHKCGATTDRAQELALSGNVHLRSSGIMDSGLRLAHFMAQLIHESGSFRYMEEIASGKAYEGRSDLGNVEPGDGVRFKGRGPLQITGRANYREFGRKLGIDLERHPELAAIPSIGFQVACEFWTAKELNLLADTDNLSAITRKVNGGLNGFDDRKAALAKMKALIL